jgi:hypothetical protein
MTERIVTPRLADIIVAIERIRRVLDGVNLEAFEQNLGKALKFELSSFAAILCSGRIVIESC